MTTFAGWAAVVTAILAMIILGNLDRVPTSISGFCGCRPMIYAPQSAYTFTGVQQIGPGYDMEGIKMLPSPPMRRALPAPDDMTMTSRTGMAPASVYSGGSPGHMTYSPGGTATFGDVYMANSPGAVGSPTGSVPLYGSLSPYRLPPQYYQVPLYNPTPEAFITTSPGVRSSLSPLSPNPRRTPW